MLILLKYCLRSQRLIKFNLKFCHFMSAIKAFFMAAITSHKIISLIIRMMDWLISNASSMMDWLVVNVDHNKRK